MLTVADFAHCQPAEFADLLTRAKIEFTPPKELSEARKVQFKRFNYDMGFDNREKKLEIRYAIRPMDKLLPNEQTQDLNKLYLSSLEGALFNISDYLPEYTVFDSDQVKSEFNADWGATSTFIPGTSFSRDYTNCLLIFLHKDDVGDVYIFFLAKEKETLFSEAQKYFYNLKFRE